MTRESESELGSPRNHQTGSVDHEEVLPVGATTTTKTGSSWKWGADASLLATACIWGTNIPVMKFGIGEERLDPFVFNASRLILSTIVFGYFVWRETQTRLPPRETESNKDSKSKSPDVTSKQVNESAKSASWLTSIPMQIVFYSLLAGLIYQLAFLYGIKNTTAGNTALILTSMPVWTAVISFFYLRERLGNITWFGLLITVTGTVIVVAQRGEISLARQHLIGNLFMLSAAICWAVGTIFSRPILKKISPLRLSFYACVLTTPIHCVFAIPVLGKSLHAFGQPAVLAAVAFSGILSTGLAYVFWHRGVRQLGASHAAIYQNVVTLIAVVGGWVFLRELPTFLQILGGGLMIAGLLVMRSARASTEHRPMGKG
jgi:drug/metabolite transporter (DMT)-like permease